MLAYSLHATRGDIATCLATTRELGLPSDALASIGVGRVTVFAADSDKLLTSQAMQWIAERFTGAAVALRTFSDASHMGAVQLRAATWLEAAAGDGELRALDKQACNWHPGECAKSVLPALAAAAV